MKLFSLIAGAVVVVAAVVVTLVLTMGGDDGGEQSASDVADRSATVSSTPPSADAPDAAYDLSTPEAAAASFVAAAKTGSGEALLDLACVGRLACVSEHVTQVDDVALTEARAQISEGVYELAVHLEGAEFGTAVDGPEPGMKNVPYRTPEMAADASLILTFVQSEGDWLYYTPTA